MFKHDNLEHKKASQENFCGMNVLNPNSSPPHSNSYILFVQISDQWTSGCRGFGPCNTTGAVHPPFTLKASTCRLKRDNFHITTCVDKASYWQY